MLNILHGLWLLYLIMLGITVGAITLLALVAAVAIPAAFILEKIDEKRGPDFSVYGEQTRLHWKEIALVIFGLIVIVWLFWL